MLPTLRLRSLKAGSKSSKAPPASAGRPCLGMLSMQRELSNTYKDPCSSRIECLQRGIAGGQLLYSIPPGCFLTAPLLAKPALGSMVGAAISLQKYLRIHAIALLG